MDILIETATATEVSRLSNLQRISIPDTGDVFFPGDTPLPFDVGPNHFVATATLTAPSFDPVTHKQLPEVVTIDSQARTIHIERPVVVKSSQELSDEREIEATEIMTNRALKALALVCANQFGMTPAQMKAAIKAEL